MLLVKFIFLKTHFDLMLETRLKYLSFILIKSLPYKIMATFLADSLQSAGIILQILL